MAAEAEDEQVRELLALEDPRPCGVEAVGRATCGQARKRAYLRRAAACGLALLGTALAAANLRQNAAGAARPHGGDGAIQLDTVQHHEACHTATPGEKCWGNVMWAMTTGLAQHPDWYPSHLTAKSSGLDFQAFLHSNGQDDGGCPMPCLPPAARKAPWHGAPATSTSRKAAPPAGASSTKAPAAALKTKARAPLTSTTALEAPAATSPPPPSAAPRARAGVVPLLAANVTCQPPLVAVPKDCYTAVEGDKCWKRVLWSRTTGVREHPEWFEGLTAGSSRDDFQRLVHRHFPQDCRLPCTEADKDVCACPPPEVPGPAGTCHGPQGPQRMSFYVYRAQSDDEYAPENVNVADLAGVMWYLHNEVVASTPRKFGVTRVLRFKITMKNTDMFVGKWHKQFGPFVAFDSGKCTAPGCNDIWKDYGFVLGCQNLDRNVANYPRYSPADDFHRKQEVLTVLRKLSSSSSSEEEEEEEEEEAAARTTTAGTRTSTDTATTSTSTTRTATVTTTLTTTTTITTRFSRVTDGLPGGIWFSLPGACPEAPVAAKTAECVKRMPGGACSTLDQLGGWDCTYHAEPAGEVSLDEISGILDKEAGIASYKDFWEASFSRCMMRRAQYEQALYAAEHVVNATRPSGPPPGPCVRNIEFNPLTDRGVGTSFWDGKHSLERATRRMDSVRELFRRKYPHFPDDHALPAPPCL